MYSNLMFTRLFELKEKWCRDLAERRALNATSI
jgi:hypothetical protein